MEAILVPDLPCQDQESDLTPKLETHVKENEIKYAIHYLSASICNFLFRMLNRSSNKIWTGPRAMKNLSLLEDLCDVNLHRP